MSTNKNKKAGRKSKETLGNFHENEAVSTETVIMICDDCIRNDLYGWIKYDPATGLSQLAKYTNRVSLAIEELGGVKATARLLDVPKREIHKWVDEHYIPYGIVEEVARLTSYSRRDLQVPLVWAEVGKLYWPSSGYLAERLRRERNTIKGLPKNTARTLRSTKPTELPS